MKHYVIIIFLAVLLTLTACNNSEIETNMSETVHEFEFITQDHETFSNKDLEGKWWIADFVFTNCVTVCLPMTTNMSKLQDMMKENDINDVQLVSFSVDPERDTPDVLKEYAESYDADLSNWVFLTTPDFQTIKELSIKSFRSALKEAPVGTDQITHGTRFYLVNPEGEVIKNYNGVMSDSLDDIVNDLKVVTKD
ncbi:SCO family protein [Lentibacillus saliphilus]|uniref:SCO family protein n=1 Tax=Lentibacillus saliphilus TaxID=2737028 RepID=UPI001C301DDD|nr:SCO family protein [Lentibacillus saliphilus]